MEFEIDDKVTLKKKLVDDELSKFTIPSFLFGKTFTVIETTLSWDETRVAYLVFDEYPNNMYSCDLFEKRGKKIDIFKKRNNVLLG